MTPSQGRVKVAILAPELVLGWTLLGPADMLYSAGMMWAWSHGEAKKESRFDVAIVGRSLDSVRCSQGVKIIPGVGLGDASYVPDVILVPTLFSESIHMGRPGWAAPWLPFMRWIEDRYSRGARVAAISTGVALLAETGLLSHRQATTHWAHMDTMAANYPDVEFVRDKVLQSAGAGSRLITTGAGTAWQSLVLLLVARYMGAEEAAKVGHLFSLEKSIDNKYRDVCNFAPRSEHGNTCVLRAQRMILHASERQDILKETMESSGLSRRSFERHFRSATGYSPLEYLQETRVQRACHMLESTLLPINEVAMRVGYNDIPYFRKLFFRICGVRPSEYRDVFGMGALVKNAKDIL